MAGVVTIELRGCREILENYPDSPPIREAVATIERSLATEPGIALTLCRGMFETVCKTILSDRGISSGAEAKPNWLMSETLKALKLTPEAFDGDSRVEKGVGDVLSGLNRLMDGIVALRNSQGVGPHGRDALESVLDASYAEIAARAMDAAVSFLYRLHRKQAEVDPLRRFSHGDHPDFDTYLDTKHKELMIEDTPLQASKALCMVEPEAYRQKLVEYRLRGKDPIEIEDDAFAEGEQVGAGNG